MLRIRWLLLFTLGCFVGCTPAKPSPPAAEKPKVEGVLAFTDLLKDEYDKLKIATKAAKAEDVHERITLTGWVMAKPGHEVTLTAPAAGYVTIRKGMDFPIAGDPVNPKQELILLEPVLSPAEKIQVEALKRSIEGEKKKAETSLVAATKDYDRIEKLHKQMLKSDQELEAALKARDHAQEELNAAKDKLKLFAMPSISIPSPQRGTVLQVHVGAGQYVAAAAPLVTVIDLNPVWIRVPVPEFDLPVVDRKASVEIIWKNPNHERGDKPAFFGSETKQLDKSPYPLAKPTGRITQVDAVKHTADLWYELDTAGIKDSFVKEQMVTVRLKLGKLEKASVVPYSAVIFDAHGSTWIYLEKPGAKDGKYLFERRRVEMLSSHDDGVIIRPTLADGELVVTNGAAALFSREFFKTPVRPK